MGTNFGANLSKNDKVRACFSVIGELTSAGGTFSAGATGSGIGFREPGVRGIDRPAPFARPQPPPPLPQNLSRSFRILSSYLDKWFKYPIYYYVVHFPFYCTTEVHTVVSSRKKAVCHFYFFVS